MKKFTVILLVPNYLAETYGQDTLQPHVMGRDPDDAVAVAREAFVVENPDVLQSQDDLFVIAVFAGHLENLAD